MGTPIVRVISSKYCLSNSIKLTVDADMGVTSSDNGVIFRVEEPSVSLHNRRVLCDVYGPVLTLYDKLSSMHGRRRVFKHDSTKSDDLLFSVKRSSFRKPRNKNINLEVFLAENTEERHCDFKVNACASKKSCVITPGGSSTILARMTNKDVEVQPNVDHAFIAALITIVHEIKINHVDASEVIGDAAVSTCWGLNIGASVADIVMNYV